MNQRILFNIASKSRPAKFKALVRSVVDLCENDNYKILAKIDNDDPLVNDYMMEGVTYSIGKSENKLHAINRNIPGYGWDIIVDLSDDFILTRKGFDKIIRDNCGPDDYLHFPEPFAESQVIKGKNESIVIMYCAGRDYYNRTGWIYNPVYKSLCADNEGTAVARKLGRYKFVNEQIFYHAHPAAGYGKADAQTKYTESFWKEDHNTYNQRKAKNFEL